MHDYYTTAFDISKRRKQGMDYDFSALLPDDMQAAVIPVGCLDDIRENIKDVLSQKHLNGFQKWILDKKYVLNIPEVGFEPKSIIIAAAPFVIRDVVFEYNDMVFRTMTACEDTRYWTQFETKIKNAGFNASVCLWLPRKLIAARTGLVQYGKNNITFAKDMGSFYGLMLYFSDMPAPEEYEWREFGYMDFCDSCQKCIMNCPTGALKKDSFILDTDLCLSAMLETGNYINDDAKRAVHALDGCYRCQDVCPFNSKILFKPRERIVFDSNDTDCILRKEMNGELKDRLYAAGIGSWAQDIAHKTLKTVFDNIR